MHAKLGGSFHRADFDRYGAARNGRAEPQETAAFKITDLLGLLALHPEQVRRARHVDIKEGPAHEEIARLCRDIFGKLGEPLSGDHTCKAALAPAAHQVGHGR